MIDVDNLDPESNPVEYRLVLAEVLEGAGDHTLGPTDRALCAEALRAQVAGSIRDHVASMLADPV